MKYPEFILFYEKERLNPYNKELRNGQLLYDLLYISNQRLAKLIATTNNDPFYWKDSDTDKFNNILIYIETNW